MRSIVLIPSLDIEDLSLEDILSSLVKPPEFEESNFALAYLQRQSLVDQDVHLTVLGSLVALLPLDPVAGKSVLTVYCFDASVSQSPESLHYCGFLPLTRRQGSAIMMSAIHACGSVGVYNMLQLV